MTHFEFLTVAVSIVLSLSVLRFVEGLRVALRRERRYWVHWGWLLAKVLSCLIYWWNLWLYQEGVSWNFAYFAFIFLGPIILFVQATALVPSQPTEVSSWRVHFMEVSRLFYLANVLFLIHQAIGPMVLRGVALSTASLIPLPLGAALSLVGAFAKGERIQTLVASLLFAGIAAVSASLLFNPPSI